MGDETHHESRSQTDPRDPTFHDVARICNELNARGARYVLVGGFAVILHGYPRYTKDIDLLVLTTLENEKKVIEAIATLPDGAAAQIEPGDISANVVVRVADEVMVDLMKSGCGVTYEMAASDAVIKEIDGVRVPVVSVPTLWKMKQTVREHDIPDRVFLRKWAEDHSVKLDPSPDIPPSEVPPWVEKFIGWLRKVFRRRD